MLLFTTFDFCFPQVTSPDWLSLFFANRYYRYFRSFPFDDDDNGNLYHLKNEKFKEKFNKKKLNFFALDLSIYLFIISQYWFYLLKSFIHLYSLGKMLACLFVVFYIIIIITILMYRMNEWFCDSLNVQWKNNEQTNKQTKNKNKRFKLFLLFHTQTFPEKYKMKISLVDNVNDVKWIRMNEWMNEWISSSSNIATTKIKVIRQK